MVHYLLFFVSLLSSAFSEELINFGSPELNKNMTFFLSTPKSGANVITGSLAALTRRPISWLYWGKSIYDPACTHRQHPSYNRLDLELVSDRPLLFRTHYAFDQLRKVPSQHNRLIFVTRNPKELLYRWFYLEASSDQNPSQKYIEKFFSEYFAAFSIYESWCPENRLLIFYEDYIQNDVEILVQMLELMGEKPLYLEDFVEHKQEYTKRLLDSYSSQHWHNSGGASSLNGPKPIHYTKTASIDQLLLIDAYIQKNAPDLWEKYLKRFQTEP